MSLRLTALFCALVLEPVCHWPMKKPSSSSLATSRRAASSRFPQPTTCIAAILVDPATGEAKLAASIDGLRFSEPRTVYLLGSTQGRQAEAGGMMLVKMNQLQTGLWVELGVGSLDARNRQLTEPVHSIRVE